MISLSEAVRKRNFDVTSEIVFKIKNILESVFGFKLKNVETWKNETSKSMGGNLISKDTLNEEDGKNILKTAILQALE